MNQTTNNSIESKIVATIWKWKFASEDQRLAIIADSDLASLLEFWFPFSEIEPTRRLGTWCDGVTFLHVEEIDRVTFSLSGVGYFPFQFSAFETEWRFRHRRDPVADSIVLRLDYVAHEKHQTSSQNGLPEYLFKSRPTQDSEWMIAVELTDI